MNRAEFLETLRKALEDASADERVAAMQYYTEYLDDAGPEREDEALKELGDPADIAAAILASPDGGAKESWAPPAAPKSGQKGGAPRMPPPPPPDPMKQAPPAWPTPPGGEEAENAQPATVPAPQAQNGGKSDWYDPKSTMVAKIIILVLACIIILPVAGGLIAALAGFLVATVVVFFAPIIAGTALVGGGVVCIVAGAFLTAASVPNGLVSIGLGVTIAMLGLMCFYAGGKLLGKTLPRIMRSVVSGVGALWNKITGKVREGTNG